MKKSTTTILAAAVSGLFMGSAMTSCASGDGLSAEAQLIAEKHACKGMNTCEGLGGGPTDTNTCAGKNDCAGLGGCATVAHHDCAGKNECKGQGGCKTATNDCAGLDECTGKGGCHVPVK